MTTYQQAEIDAHRERLLDECLAKLWPCCQPCTTKVGASSKRVTAFGNPPADLARVEGFVEGYNAAMDDARRLIGPSGLADRYVIANVPQRQREPMGKESPPHRDRRQRGRSSAARAAAEALFKKGGTDAL